jgi:hypothetical protein
MIEKQFVKLSEADSPTATEVEALIEQAQEAQVWAKKEQDESGNGSMDRDLIETISKLDKGTLQKECCNRLFHNHVAVLELKTCQANITDRSSGSDKKRAIEAIKTGLVGVIGHLGRQLYNRRYDEGRAVLSALPTPLKIAVNNEKVTASRKQSNYKVSDTPDPVMESNFKNAEAEGAKPIALSNRIGAILSESFNNPKIFRKSSSIAILEDGEEIEIIDDIAPEPLSLEEARLNPIKV